MASTKTRTRTVRISNESADYFEKLPLNRVIESVYTLILEKAMSFDGEPSKNDKNSGLTPNSDLKEIEDVALFFGISTEELLEGMCAGLMDGNLTVEKGKVVGIPDINLENFKDACHLINKEPQEMLDKVVGLIEKGRI